MKRRKTNNSLTFQFQTLNSQLRVIDWSLTLAPSKPYEFRVYQLRLHPTNFHSLMSPVMVNNSATEVDVAPVMEKSGTTGKRGPEVALEKKSGAKKSKKNEAIQKAIERMEAELRELKKMMESSSGSSDEAESDGEPKEPVAAPAKEVPDSDAQNGPGPVKEAKDCSIADSQTLEEEHNGSIPAAAEKVDSEGSSGADDSGSEEDSGTGVEMSDADKNAPKTPSTTETIGSKTLFADADKNAPKTPSTPEATGSKTLFAGNLSFTVEEVDVRDFFESAGEIVDVRLCYDHDGRFKGFGHIEFASEAEAQNALKLNQKELRGRPIRLDLAYGKGEYTPATDSSENGQTLLVKGFNSTIGEDEIRKALEEHFGKCGEITRLSIPVCNDGPKGFAFIDFKDSEAYQEALKLDQSEVGGIKLTVFEGRPRNNAGSGRGGGRFGSGGRFHSGGRNSSGGFGRGGRRGGGRRGGGRGGRRGGAYFY